MKKHLSTLLKIISSLLILYLLFVNIDFNSQEFSATWKAIDMGWLVLALPVVILVLGIKSLRWKAIIAAQGYSYGFMAALSAYFASYSLGVVTPGRLGELLKVYNLRKDQPHIEVLPAFATVVLDRLFDMFFLLWFGLSGLVFFFAPFGEMATGFILMLILIVLLVGLVVANWFLKLILKKYAAPNAMLVFVQTCFGQMLSARNASAWLLTTLAYAIYFAGIQILFLALHIQIPFIETGFIISLIGLLLLLPISVAGFGTREAGLVFLLAFYSISPELAISFSLLQFLTFFVWGGLVGLLFWMVSPISLSIIRSDTQKIFKKIKKSMA
jgi:hypothetical protein